MSRKKVKQVKQVNAFGRFQFKIRLFFDSVAILLAWFLAYYIKFFIINDGDEDPVRLFSLLSIVAWFSTYFLIYINKLYEAKNTSNWRLEVGQLFKSSFYEFLFFTALYYYVFNYRISRQHMVIYFCLLFVFLVIDRWCVNQLFASYIRTGSFRQRVLLVGYGERIEEYFTAVRTQGESRRLRIAGQYLGSDAPIEGVVQIEAENLLQAAEMCNADVIVISFPTEEYKREREIIKEGLEVFTQKVYTLPNIPKSYVGSVVSDFHQIPTLELNSFNLTTGKKFMKRFFDLCLCIPAVLILSPLYLFIALLVKLSSKGPVFFAQERVTENGKVFKMLKFRSMRVDMPEKGGAHWTTEGDPRITRIGRILRKTSLDEIPQFFNVIQGSMSLIGPRPERPELESQFKEEIPGYHMRHRMKAGISGWAQVNGLRGNTSLEKRIDFDLFYIRNWSLWFDCKIIFLTFFKGFINKNAY